MIQGFSGYSIVRDVAAGASTPSGPTNTVAPAVTGTPTVGQTLSCSTGTWSGTGTITYAYQWQRDGSNISGATSSTYTLVEADASTSVRCVVTATDDIGSTAANSNAVSVSGSASAIDASSPDADWDASAGVTEIGGGVSSWVDQAGSFEAQQTTAGSRPSYGATAMNGSPGISFDAIDDHLFVSDNATLNVSTGDLSIAVVFSTTGLSGTRTLLAKREILNEGYQLAYDTAERIDFFVEGTSEQRFDNADKIDNAGGTNIIILRCNRDGNFTMYMNGAGATSQSGTAMSANGSWSNIGKFSIGARVSSTLSSGDYGDATIARVLVWQRDLTDTEVNDVGADLVTNYGGAFTGPA